MREIFMGLIAAAVTLLAAAGCGGADTQAAEPPMGTAAPEPKIEGPEPMDPEIARGAAIHVRSQEPYGQYIADSEGRALYMFMADQQGQSSACYDECAEAWPPLFTEGTPRAGDPSVQDAMLGTITRRDGREQATYAGWPLYYYARDEQPGDVNGQDVMGFGGEWYVVSPTGDAIKATAEQGPGGHEGHH